jgi:hypothetical protein
MKHTLEEIIELAKDVELTDNVDWTNLRVERDVIYQMIGSSVYEQYHDWKASSSDIEAIMLATITKLVIENFVLNLKLESLN